MTKQEPQIMPKGCYDDCKMYWGCGNLYGSEGCHTRLGIPVEPEPTCPDCGHKAHKGRCTELVPLERYNDRDLFDYRSCGCTPAEPDSRKVEKHKLPTMKEAFEQARQPTPTMPLAKCAKGFTIRCSICEEIKPDDDGKCVYLQSQQAHDSEVASKAVKELLDKIDKMMELEKCDPTVMAYFNAYYWIDKDEWEEFKVRAMAEDGR